MNFFFIHYEKNQNRILSTKRRRGIVVMDFDCYTGDHGSIPAHGDSLGKWMSLHPGQPMNCEENLCSQSKVLTGH